MDFFFFFITEDILRNLKAQSPGFTLTRHERDRFDATSCVMVTLLTEHDILHLRFVPLSRHEGHVKEFECPF